MRSREWFVDESERVAGGGSGEYGTDAAHLGLQIDGLRLAVLAAIAEPEPPTNIAAAPALLSTWGYLELMGHRTIVGYVEEDDFAGRRVLRVRELKRADRKPGVGEPDPPLELDERWRIYSPSAVYGFEPIATEQEARSRYLSGHGYADEIPF